MNPSAFSFPDDTRRLPPRDEAPLNAGTFSVEEIAEAAVFLSSPSAHYITGTILDVDGGSQLGDATPRSLGKGLA